jgi:signal transduction histidine kinase
MERQMGRDTLKHVLSQRVQLLERDFTGLLHSGTAWNDLHIRSLDIIKLTIRRLAETIDTLSTDEEISIDMRHELRNQITVVMGYAQLMLHRRAGALPPEASSYLRQMMMTVLDMNTFLDDNRHQARNG